jgi:DNA polymerase-1
MASGDEYLCAALKDKYDIHMEWAQRIAKVYHSPVDDMKEFRSVIKNKFVFPAFYGANGKTIAGYLDMDPGKMIKVFDAFWDTFSDVYAWQQRVVKNYRKNGYVETLTGRRRRAPLTTNKAINMPVQGTASDIVVDAMNRLSELGQRIQNFDDDDREISCYQPIMNIHDDLTFYIPEAEAEDYFTNIIRTMVEVPFKFVGDIPIEVEAAVGPNWFDMEDIGTFETGDL